MSDPEGNRGASSPDPFEMSLDPAAYERWLPPLAAVKKLEPLLKPSEAKAEIYRRISGGEVLTVARSSTWYTRNGLDLRDYARLGAFLWAFNSAPSDADLLWKTGTHTLSRVLNHLSTQRYNVECFGIRFDPAGIQTILTDAGIEDTATAKGAPSVDKPRRGAKRKDWWDHLWIEMIRRIQAGALHPKNKAELQEILEVYASNTLGENCGDSTLKPMASNLFDFLEKNRGK